MRAAFVEGSDWFYGPESTFGPPGTQYAAAIPSRFVPQNQIDQYTLPFELSTAWVTLDSFKPNVAVPQLTALGKTFTNWLSSDRVVMSFQPLKTWYVVRVEQVRPVWDAPYWRALVANVDTLGPAFWPPPYECPCAGPDFGCEEYAIGWGDEIGDKLMPRVGPAHWQNGIYNLAAVGNGALWVAWYVAPGPVTVAYQFSQWDGSGGQWFDRIGPGSPGQVEVSCSD